MEILSLIIGLFFIVLGIVTYLMPLEKKRKFYLKKPNKGEQSEGHFNVLSFIYILIGIMSVISGLFSFN